MKAKKIPMDKNLEDKLRYLRLTELLNSWDEMIAQAKDKNLSYTAFLKQIIERECSAKKERARLRRVASAKIEEPFVIETYPFERQQKLNRKKILDLFDSMAYLTKKQNLVFVGPTGVGKTGIGTSLLTHAISQGATGRFISFPDLLHQLYQSVADHSEEKTLRRFINYECLLIDEMGYVEVDPHQAGLFFTLMKKRHKKATTIITTQLGFKEWAGFLKNSHLTAALIDRLTENCQVINMNKCASIRENTSPQNSD
jgi:DNA replication protein DnaC